MGDQIYIFLDKEKFKEKLNSFNNEFELEELLHYLLFLDGFLQGRPAWLVEMRKVKNTNDLRDLIVEVFDNIYEDDIEEFKENLESDVSKDLFKFFMKSWKAILTPFLLDQSLYLEGTFIPFEILSEYSLIDKETKKKIEEEKISLRNAIKSVVKKLKDAYDET